MIKKRENDSKKWFLSKNWKKKMILKAKQVKRPWGRSKVDVLGRVRRPVWVATVQKWGERFLK